MICRIACMNRVAVLQHLLRMRWSAVFRVWTEPLLLKCVSSVGSPSVWATLHSKQIFLTSSVAHLIKQLLASSPFVQHSNLPFFPLLFPPLLLPGYFLPVWLHVCHPQAWQQMHKIPSFSVEVHPALAVSACRAAPVTGASAIFHVV